MTKFPEPIPLPSDVYLARMKRNRQVLKFATIGISSRLAIMCIELIGFYLTQSAALFTDAISTFADVFATAFLLICLKLAQRPPDEDHPFGHGRYEPFGGLLLGLLLLVTGMIMFIQQVFGAIQEHVEFSVHPFSWVFPFISLILLEACYRLMIETSKEAHSPALAADAAHYRVDSITSLLAMIALIAANYFPAWSHVLDHAGAISIAIFMLLLGIYACKENFYQLMDKVPDISFFNKVKNAAYQVKGVKWTEKIRIQSYGPDAHVDIDIEVEPTLSVEAAHEISQQVRVEIQKSWPAVRDVTVHIEPYYMNDH